MYKIIIKPLLFWLNIERAKRVVILLLQVLERIPVARMLLRRSYLVEDTSLECEVFGLRFPNRVGLAAGFDVNGDITSVLGDLGFGFVEVGTVTPLPQDGNPKSRIFRLPKDRAIVQRLGNPNRGWEYVIERLRGRKHDTIVGCNIAQNSTTQVVDAGKDLLKCFRNFYQYADYFTVTIQYHSLTGGDSIAVVEAITEQLSSLFEFRRGQSDYRPILVKLPADLSDDMIDAVTDVLITTPLDGVVAIAGSHSRRGLETAPVNVSRIGAGRLSGRPIKERAVEVVRRVHERSGGAYPIIGVGGMSSAEDVKEMMEAGASLVQIYTGFIYEGPSLIGDVCRSMIAEEPTVDSVAPVEEI